MPLPRGGAYRCAQCSKGLAAVFHKYDELCPGAFAGIAVGANDSGSFKSDGALARIEQERAAEAASLIALRADAAAHARGDGIQGGESSEDGKEGDGMGSVPEPTNPLEELIHKIARARDEVVAEVFDKDNRAIKDTVRTLAEVISSESIKTEQMRTDLIRQVEDIAANATAAVPRDITIRNVSTGTVKSVTGKHRMFQTVLRLAAARKNSYLVGPSGSGKTVGAADIAEALDLVCYPYSMGPTTTEYSIMGFINATGGYVPGIAYKPYTEGGVLVLDEMDAASAAVLTTLNTLLGNNFCSFPHEVFTKHPDFVVIASGNTWGRGATREYIGRAPLDAATLNRFFMVPWDYDIAFESALASSLAGVNITPAVKTRQEHLPKVVAEDKRAALAAEWTQYVWDVRESIEEHSVRAVVGSRDIVEGVDAIMMAGFTLPEVATMRFLGAMTVDDRARVERSVESLVANRKSVA